MPHLTIYRRNKPNLDIENPNPEQVIQGVEELDGVRATNLQLTTRAGYLFVYSSREGRMHLVFTDAGINSGYLIDKTQTSDQVFEFPLENGAVDDWSIQETVSREVARDVALYFLQNNTLPKGLDWEGNMADFA